MYKLILLIAVVLTFAPAKVKAQCTPDTTNFNFFYPAAEDLPCIVRNQYYETVIQLFCPPQIAIVSIDSLHLTNILNLPQGITYTCSAPDCVIKAFQHACLFISGTTTDTVGRYFTQSEGMSYTSLGAAPFSQLPDNVAPNYYFDVVENIADCDAVSVNDVTEQPLSLGFNPAVRQLYITGNQTQQPGNIQLYDLTGRMVFETRLPAMYSQTVQLPNQLPTGTYCAAITAGASTLTKVVVLQ
jgi:hypothetical protein